MMRPLIDRVFIPGHARTKGSLDVVNAGRKVLADSEASVRWRAMMAYRLSAAYAGRPMALGPIKVTADVTLPVSAEALLTRQSGDVDKLARNLLDALAHDPKKPKLSAGVYRDDSQVVELSIMKQIVTQDWPPGIYVSVWEIREMHLL
jgi:Holliday junction resolvase RusA-like endonuclease